MAEPLTNIEIEERAKEITCNQLIFALVRLHTAA